MSTSIDDKNPSEIEINAVLDRIIEFIGAKSDTDLAKAMNVSRQVIFGWRKRGTIPYDRLIQFALSKGLSLDYLITGISGEIDPDTIGSIADRLDLEQMGKPVRLISDSSEIAYYSALIYKKIHPTLAKLKAEDFRLRDRYMQVEIKGLYRHLAKLFVASNPDWKDSEHHKDDYLNILKWAGEDAPIKSADKNEDLPYFEKLLQVESEYMKEPNKISQIVLGNDNQVAGGNIKNSGAKRE